MADEFDLRPYKDDGEDRLPWLETVQPDPPARPWGRIVAGALVAVAAMLALIVGVRSYRQHQEGGNGELIAAQEGDYKVRPDDPGGLRIPGEGDAAIRTSAGRDQSDGAIDLKAMPEVPIMAIFPNGKPSPAASAAAPGGRNTVAPVPASGGKLVAAPPAAVPKPAPAPGGGGSLVQLGAFPSQAQADAAWASVAKRFSYVASLGKSVQTVSVGGKTLYRLRVNAGSANAAADICGRLKVAGEGCFIAS